MHIQNEIIVLFFIISFLVYTMPDILVNFSRTLRGKFLLLVLTIVVTLYNKTGGILMVMFFIFLSEFNYEFNTGILYEGFSFDRTDQPNQGSLNYRLDSNTLVKRQKQDKMTIEQSLLSVDSATLVGAT